jgi:hypothetical protein
MEIGVSGGVVRQAFVPVVRCAIRRRIDGGAPDCGDCAMRLELGVIARRGDEVTAEVIAALAAVREMWEPKSPAYSLLLTCRSRAGCGETIGWDDEIACELVNGAREG